MSAAPALVIEELHKSFDKREVLTGIDLSVAEHEVVCLIGASGSGKSTLLRCINLIEPIDAGIAAFDEEIRRQRLVRRLWILLRSGVPRRERGTRDDTDDGEAGCQCHALPKSNTSAVLDSRARRTATPCLRGRCGI